MDTNYIEGWDSKGEKYLIPKKLDSKIVITKGGLEWRGTFEQLWEKLNEPSPSYNECSDCKVTFEGEYCPRCLQDV